MALSDLTVTVEVNKGEYTELVKQSVKLEIIKLLVQDVLVNVDTIRTILGVETIGAGPCQYGVPEEIEAIYKKEREE